MKKRSASPLEVETNFSSPGTKRDYDEKELKRISVVIQRKIHPEKRSNAPIKRSVSDPEKITVVRKRGEGARPIFDRVELYHNSKDPKSRPKECRKVVKVTDDFDRDKGKKKLSMSPIRPSKHSTLKDERISENEKATSSTENGSVTNHQNMEPANERSRSREHVSSKLREKETRKTTHCEASRKTSRETSRDNSGNNNNTTRETSCKNNNTTRETSCKNNNTTRETSRENNNNNTTRETTRETICILPMMHQLRPTGPFIPRGPMPAPYCILPPQRFPPPIRPLFRPPFRHPFPPRVRPPPYFYG